MNCSALSNMPHQGGPQEEEEKEDEGDKIPNVPDSIMEEEGNQ